MRDGSYTSILALINLKPRAATATLQLQSDDGSPVGDAVQIQLAAGAKAQVSESPGNAGAGQGHIEVRRDGARRAGSVTFRDARQDAFATALPLISWPDGSLVFSPVASNDTCFTGIALLNTGNTDAGVRIKGFDAQGNVTAAGDVQIRARGRLARLLTEHFPDLSSRQISSGCITVESDQPLAGCALFGTRNPSALPASPVNRGENRGRRTR